MNYSEVIFYNPGVLKIQLSPELFLSAKSEVDRSMMRAEKFNQNLVGNIQKEYSFMLPKELYEFVTKMYEDYRIRYNYKPDIAFKVSPQAWVNYMKKHEFNPSHTHTGLASYVIWVNIPYDLEAEFNQPNVSESIAKRASLFEFHYNTLDGTQNTCPLIIDKSWEGTMVMFPAVLHHTVYPFYSSDGYRISIAGNIYQS